MNKKINISCLPVAGIGNPYQYLMIDGLNSDDRIHAISGVNDRFFGIIRTAISQRPDYIHFDWESSYYYRKNLMLTLVSIPAFVLQIWIVRVLFKCKLVWTPHNITPHDSKYLKLHRFCRRIFARNMYWIRLFSDVSKLEAMREFRCESHKFKIVPEGSYVKYYANNVSSADARKFLNIGSQTLVMLYVGFIKPYKGIIELIREFKKAPFADCILIVAGDVINKSYFELLKSEIDDRIILVDRFINNDELQFFFNAADIVTLPFKKIENSGSVILAMSFKKAIIAPEMGVLTERLINQRELLYRTSITEAFDFLKTISREQLDRFGRQNFDELSKHTWADFSMAFTGN